MSRDDVERRSLYKKTAHGDDGYRLGVFLVLLYTEMEYLIRYATHDATQNLEFKFRVCTLLLNRMLSILGKLLWPCSIPHMNVIDELEAADMI